MSLRAVISELADDPEFGDRAAATAIADAESKLGIVLPAELKAFLAEADGVSCDHGAGVIWSVARIASENAMFRSNPDFRDLYMGFDSLLFVGDDGGGDQFAYAIHADGQINKPDIFRWHHETDAREWFAGSLASYINKRLSDSYYE